MKKNYFKPEAELVDVRIDSYILNDSNGGTVKPGVGFDEEGGPNANKNRGEWGNVWGK